MLDVRGDPPDPRHLEQAVAALRAGRPVVLPTETVYGLAVDPAVAGATDRLFALKGRPKSVPVAVLVAGLDQLAGVVAAISPGARRLMDRFWPGPLTLVLPRHPDLVVDLGAAPHTVGVRCPAHPVPLALTAAVGPLATTSANRHGEATPHEAADVAAELAIGAAVVLDGGRCDQPPSTVVDLTGPEIAVLREGLISRAELHAVAEPGREG